MNPQELIAKLKAQHLTLQEDLESILDYLTPQEGVEGTVILEILQKFKIDLIGHLQLENDSFYLDYFNKKSLINADVNSEQIFREEMNYIGTTIMNFLNKYSTPETIGNNPEEFKIELSGIINTLKLRITTEEKGIYNVYLAL